MAKEAAAGAVQSVASRQNTQREYETVTILRPDTGKPQIKSLIERVQGVVEKQSGNLIKIDSWGMRVLAYPVAHQRKGIYLYWRYLGGSDMVAEVERNMRLSDRVMRFYSVRVDDDVDPNARPSEIDDELLDAVSEPGPDPDELARQAAEEEAKRIEAEQAAAAAEAAKAEAAKAEESNTEPAEAAPEGN
ncbi:MAG: 30S ribosomal protein S6 [Nannocystaceae bacterium]|nr:30S ribosomal protein S6 [bacterium]